MDNRPETLQAQGPEGINPTPLELEPGQGWRDKTKNWLKKNSSIILAIVIIILLGVGIYAYSKKTQTPPYSFEEEPTETLETQNNEGLAEVTEGEEAEEQTQTELEIKEGEQGIIKNSEKTKETDKEVIVETAQKGDGITHLARRALAKYLEKTGGDPELTKEHKIFIEDYLQNRTGNEWLNVGETRSFSIDLIKEAVQEAKKLNQQQLEKISQFAQLVPSID
jgi:hypothetical protein